MPHGHPDYGIGAPTQTIYTIEDMAELAARLGSIVTFDRRGNVCFLEDFEGSLAKCVTEYIGTGASISIVSDVACGGSFSCKLVTGNSEDDYALVRIRQPYPILSKMAIEVAWFPASSAELFQLELWLYDGAKYYSAKVRWDSSIFIWQYLDPVTGWTDISADIYYYVDETSFNRVKLVIDFSAKKYGRLMVNDLTWDLSAKDIPSGADLSNAHLLGQIVVFASADANKTLYLDNIILTQNEP